MFSSSQQLHFQSPAAVPRLHILGDTKGQHMNRQQHMRLAAFGGKKRTWVNAPMQALMHLDLCTMPLLFILSHYFPAPVVQHLAETVEQTLERVVPQRDGSRSWKKSTSLALLVFSPSRWHPHFWIQLQL